MHARWSGMRRTIIPRRCRCASCRRAGRIPRWFVWACCGVSGLALLIRFFFIFFSNRDSNVVQLIYRSRSILRRSMWLILGMIVRETRIAGLRGRWVFLSVFKAMPDADFSFFSRILKTSSLGRKNKDDDEGISFLFCFDVPVCSFSISCRDVA